MLFLEKVLLLIPFLIFIDWQSKEILWKFGILFTSYLIGGCWYETVLLQMIALGQRGTSSSTLLDLLSLCNIPVILRDKQSRLFFMNISDIVTTIFVLYFKSQYVLTVLILYTSLNDLIMWLIQTSFSPTERGLASAGLVYLLFSSDCDPYKVLIAYPLIALLSVYPFFLKVVKISSILGKHKRPKNAEILKKRYALIISLVYPAAFAVLAVLSCGLDNLKKLVLMIFQDIDMLKYWFVIFSIIIISVIALHSMTVVKEEKHEFSLRLAKSSKLSKSQRLLLDVRRKVWHFLAVVLFAPFVSSPSISYWLAIAMVGFLLLELVRATTLPPLGPLLHSFLSNFTDERDTQGPMIVSHLFLLLGVSIPIILHKSPAGLLVLGIGDASASLVGRSIGKRKVFGTQKTIIGTFAFSVTTFVAFNLLTSLPLPRTIFVSVLCALLEAVSPQNDNIIIPLYAMCLTL